MIRLPRRVLALGAAALALAGLALLGPPGPSTRVDIDYRLPALDAVQTLTLRQTGAPAVTIRRTPEGWRVGDGPLDGRAEAALKAVFAGPVAMDKAEQVPEADLGRYSLGADTLTVTFETAAGAQTVRVGKVVDGRRTFIRPTPGDTVYRARADLRRALDRPTMAWRMRRLFPALRFADVRALQLERAGRLDWRVSRAGPDAPWAAPGGGRLAQQEVVGAVNTFVGAEAIAFLGEAPFTPALTLEAETFDGARHRLLLGPRAPDGSAAGRREPDGLGVRLPSHQVHFLDVGAAALTERRLFSVDPATVRAMVFGGATPIRVSRTEAGWAMEAPRAVPDLPSAAVGDVLSEVLAVKAAGIAAAPPPDAFADPHHTVLIRLDGDRQVALTIGAAFQSGARYARTSEAPEVTYVLSAGSVAATRPAVERFLAHP